MLMKLPAAVPKSRNNICPPKITNLGLFPRFRGRDTHSRFSMRTTSVSSVSWFGYSRFAVKCLMK